MYIRILYKYYINVKIELEAIMYEIYFALMYCVTFSYN